MDASFYCGKCKSRLGWPDDIDDAAEVRCEHCDESAGTFGELKDAAAEAAARKIDDMLGRILKD